MAVRRALLQALHFRGKWRLDVKLGYAFLDRWISIIRRVWATLAPFYQGGNLAAQGNAVGGCSVGGVAGGASNVYTMRGQTGWKEGEVGRPVFAISHRTSAVTEINIRITHQ